MIDAQHFIVDWMGYITFIIFILLFIEAQFLSLKPIFFNYLI
jgi:hypothetical protein